MKETKNIIFKFETKSQYTEGGEDGSFTGYGSVFGVLDNQNDIILKGAFERSLLEKGADIKLLWQHKTDEPIGVFDEIREDEYGLYVKGRLLLDVQRAREAYALMKVGALKGLSIGYSVNVADFEEIKSARLIVDVDLFEVSLVTFPANKDAVAVV